VNKAEEGQELLRPAEVARWRSGYYYADTSICIGRSEGKPTDTMRSMCRTKGSSESDDRRPKP
jgi:hypothetical protein